eukprot:2776837-Prymnesium_polylepis.1
MIRVRRPGPAAIPNIELVPDWSHKAEAEGRVDKKQLRTSARAAAANLLLQSERARRLGLMRLYFFRPANAARTLQRLQLENVRQGT